MSGGKPGDDALRGPSESDDRERRAANQADPPPRVSSSENPMAQFPLSLSVPDIEVRMVNAAGLEDYEIWLFIASLSSSATVGFVVAWLQSGELIKGETVGRDAYYLVVAGVFFVVFAVTFIRALQLRQRIRKAGNTYRMQLVSVAPLLTHARPTSWVGRRRSRGCRAPTSRSCPSP